MIFGQEAKASVLLQESKTFSANMIKLHGGDINFYDRLCSDDT